jgi:Flp pilus assembly protein TadD
MVRKLLWTFQSEEIRDSHSFYFFEQQSWLLRILPGMGILLPIACIGLLVAAPTRVFGVWRPNQVNGLNQTHVGSLLAFYAAGAAASVVFLVVGTRYRMPIVPALAIASGAALTAIVGALKARDKQALTVYAVTAGIAIAASHALNDPANRNVAEEWAFTGSALITEHNLPEAENAYRRALALDPASGFAWDGLGLVQYNGGRLADARQSLERALARDPDSARAVYHLALVDEREGRLAAAIAGFRKALGLSPDDVEIARDLGSALLAANQASDAVPYLRLVASQAPGDPDAHRALATALGTAGQSAEARTEMRRVLELSPTNGEAWVDLCLLSIDVREIEAATEACGRARELGADRNRLSIALRALEQFAVPK